MPRTHEGCWKIAEHMYELGKKRILVEMQSHLKTMSQQQLIRWQRNRLKEVTHVLEHGRNDE